MLRPVAVRRPHVPTQTPPSTKTYATLVKSQNGWLTKKLLVIPVKAGAVQPLDAERQQWHSSKWLVSCEARGDRIPHPLGEQKSYDCSPSRSRILEYPNENRIQYPPKKKNAVRLPRTPPVLRTDTKPPNTHLPEEKKSSDFRFKMISKNVL